MDDLVADKVPCSIFSFAFGFAGGLMPKLDGFMLGLVFFLIIGLFVYHPDKKK